MSLILHPDLSEHLKNQARCLNLDIQCCLTQTWRLPQRSVMQTFKVNVDWCSMLYCREFVYTADRTWYGHLRLDSSPQYCKNYLLGEMDQICFVETGPDLERLLLELRW